MKPIRLSDHALRYTTKGGFTISEVEETIRTTPWMRAELGRLDCRENFPYRKEWNGKVYDQTGSPDLHRGNGRNSCDHGLGLLF